MQIDCSKMLFKYHNYLRGQEKSAVRGALKDDRKMPKGDPNCELVVEYSREDK